MDTQDRDDKWSGVEMNITETFDKINPNDPLRLVKEIVRRQKVDFQTSFYSFKFLNLNISFICS